MSFQHHKCAEESRHREGFDTPPAPRACHPRWVREKATVTRTWRRLNSLVRSGEGTVLCSPHCIRVPRGETSTMLQRQAFTLLSLAVTRKIPVGFFSAAY